LECGGNPDSESGHAAFGAPESRRVPKRGRHCVPPPRNQNTPLVLSPKVRTIIELRRYPKTLAYILAGLSLAAAARALVTSSSSDPYQAIPERNLFGLKPPPQITNESPATQLAKIVLTGITTILGDKRALMKLLPPIGKPGDPANEQSLILSEGQRDGKIEVLAIDENAGSVKVNNCGTVVTLTFEKDGARLPDMTPPVGLPSATQPSSVPGASHSFGHPANGPPSADRRLKTFAMRNVRLPGPSESGEPPTAAGPVFIPTAGEMAAPLRRAATGAASAQDRAQEVTPEAQTIMLELQRQANQQNASFPPLPPTAITPEPPTPAAQSPGASIPATAQPGLPQ